MIILYIKILIFDVPLLFESGIENLFDLIIVVKCKRNKQIKRAKSRDKLAIDKVLKRINCQMPIGEKIAKADIIIENNKSVRETRKQVERIREKLFSIAN